MILEKKNSGYSHLRNNVANFEKKIKSVREAISIEKNLLVAE